MFIYNAVNCVASSDLLMIIIEVLSLNPNLNFFANFHSIIHLVVPLL